MAVPDSIQSFLFGVGPNFSSQNDAGLLAFEDACRRIYERSRDLRAGVYPVGYPVGTSTMTEAEWRRQFPVAWERLRASKRSYDPDGILPSIARAPNSG